MQKKHSIAWGATALLTLFACGGNTATNESTGATDAGAHACVPGQSIACAGPGGCSSFQVCNASGTAYGSCDCGATERGEEGGSLDGFAPLPPPVGDQEYNAFWSASTHFLFVPLFSAPQCGLDYPYGDYYAVAFQPNTVGPVGTFSACGAQKPGAPPPCYSPERWSGDPSGGTNFQDVPGGVYTLNAFNADGIATGQMNTAEGIVPLVVKNCP